MPFKELHIIDQEEDPRGIYRYYAESKEKALDQFHDEIPIKVLDDFEITISGPYKG